MKHLIEMDWWAEEGGSEPKVEHRDALVESGVSQVFPLLEEGYREGIMADHVRMTDDDPEDGVAYRGYWKISEATAQEVSQ